MSGEVAIPVWLRVGSVPEHMIGTVTVDVASEMSGTERAALAALLREAADVIEQGET